MIPSKAGNSDGRLAPIRRVNGTPSLDKLRILLEACGVDVVAPLRDPGMFAGDGLEAEAAGPCCLCHGWFPSH
jgi:hypothetical protein